MQTFLSFSYLLYIFLFAHRLQSYQLMKVPWPDRRKHFNNYRSQRGATNTHNFLTDFPTNFPAFSLDFFSSLCCSGFRKDFRITGILQENTSQNTYVKYRDAKTKTLTTPIKSNANRPYTGAIMQFRGGGRGLLQKIQLYHLVLS